MNATSTGLDMTIRQAVEQIYRPPLYTTRSIEVYKKSCKAWERLTGNPTIRNITDNLVNQFETDLTDLGLQPSTIRTYCGHVRAVLNNVLNKSRRNGVGGYKAAQQLPSVIPAELDGTLLSYFEVLYRRQRLAGKSAGTVRKFRIAIRQFSRVLHHEATLVDLTDQNILDLMTWLADRGRSPETVNSNRAKLVALWGFLAKKRYVESFPDVLLFDESEKTPQAWNESQLQKLFGVLAKQRGKICGLPAADWFVTLHHFLLCSAERINAALTLAPSDVDLESRWVRVKAINRKGKTRDRSYRLDPETHQAIKAFIELDPGRELVWPLTVTRERLWQRYEEILKSAGLPSGRESKFHRMRKTALSFFKAKGGNASELADHASPATTRRHYLDPTICPEVQACDVLADVLKKTRQRAE